MVIERDASPTTFATIVPNKESPYLQASCGFSHSRMLPRHHQLKQRCCEINSTPSMHSTDGIRIAPVDSSE
jgi:hypothetical protein